MTAISSASCWMWPAHYAQPMGRDVGSAEGPGWRHTSVVSRAWATRHDPSLHREVCWITGRAKQPSVKNRLAGRQVRGN